MADLPDSGLPAGGKTPPQSSEDSIAFNASGAIAPLDNVVVSVAFGSKKGQGASGVLSSSSVGGNLSSGSPTPLDSAATHDEGAGADKPALRKARTAQKKAEKTIDWGKFNTLIDNFALIYGTDTVWDGTERIIMKISNMGHAHGADMVRMWKGAERRRTVRQEDVVFDPTETCGEECINIYDGMAMEPKAGEVGPILDLVRFLTSRSSTDPDVADNIMHWLLCWLAYPLQHPGFKLRTSVVMHGDEGAGKNFLFDMIVAIYGKYGVLVGQDELEDKFNDWRSGKMFIVGDEVSSRAELVHNKNRLKAIITSPTAQINPKGLPRRTEANHSNVAFLSNELQPLALDNSDRRYLVIYTPRKREMRYYTELVSWRDNGGLPAFYAYLLDYPLADFDPYAPAPFTDAKADLIGINRKSPERFWWDWSEGELDLPYASCSQAQAYEAYLKYCQRTGERFPMNRPIFTPMVERFAEANDKPVRIKVMKLDTAGAKKAERMFLVCDPPLDQPQGEWASETVRLFAEHLKAYMRWSRSPGLGDDGPGESA